jgi:hypothetical protein
MTIKIITPFATTAKNFLAEICMPGKILMKIYF